MGFSHYSSEGRSDRSVTDRLRHRGKLKQAIVDAVPGIITEESIVGGTGRKVKIPLRGITEYQFVHGNNEGKGVATGDVQRGQTLKKQGNTKAPANGAGDEAGDDYIELEIEVGELLEYLFQDLALPDLDNYKKGVIKDEKATKRHSYRKEGPRVRLNKRRSMRERVKRKLASGWQPVTDTEGNDTRFPFREHDLRYRHIKTVEKPTVNAVVLFMMDVSGSMGAFEKYCARTLFFFIYQFLKYRYGKIEVVFLAHTTQAKEVDEYTFFHNGESGGTMISSVLSLGLDIIQTRYDPSVWNVYTFYCSDGDNQSNDNPATRVLFEKLLDVCNRVGYVEVNAYDRSSTVSYTLRNLQHERFRMDVVRDKNAIWPTFVKLLEARR